MDEKRIKELEAQIADLKKRWPAHSVSPAMLMQLDELEEVGTGQEITGNIL
jgi:hypothetical protein